MARGLLLFVALVAIAIAGAQLVSANIGHNRADLSWILGSIGYGLLVCGIPALIFLVPGLLFLAAADGKLPRALLHLVAALVSALAFAPFIFVTTGGVDVIPLAAGALAYAVSLAWPPSRSSRARPRGA
jgi:hypothetical protein